MSERSWGIFDSAYASYYELTTGHRPYDAEAEALCRLALELGLKPPQELLDVGCGTGGHAKRLAERGFRVLALDPAEAMIRHAVAAPGVEYLCRRLEDFVPDRALNFAYSMGHVVNYLPDSASLASFSRQIARILGGKGAYYFEFWNPAALLEEAPREVEREYSTPRGILRRRVSPRGGNAAEGWIALNYRIEDRSGALLAEVDHRLRLFSAAELEACWQAAGFATRLCPVLGDRSFTEGGSPRFLGLLATLSEGS